MSSGPLKTFKITVIPGQAGQAKLFPSNNPSPDDFVHTILGELRVEDNTEVIIEDGVDLLVAESSTSCYLMVSGVVKYEV